MGILLTTILLMTSFGLLDGACECPRANTEKTGRLFYTMPAPGRKSGRIYYYLPPAVDLEKPSALLVFLHGGDGSTPDTMPEQYFGENVMPAFEKSSFIVAAPSAPPANHGSRWNQIGVWKLIDATIADAKGKFKIDPDRIFLGGHSMGGYGAYHNSLVMADRFAGVWLISGGWWESDFRSLYGTPAYIQHGVFDCHPDVKYHPTLPYARKHYWCGVDFARAAHELMTRYGVEHVYDEYQNGHSISTPEAQAAASRFFAWASSKRRDPYAKKCAIITPCGTKHPCVEDVVRSRWLEMTMANSDFIEFDAIALTGPHVAKTENDFKQQTYRLERHIFPQGARLIVENLGDNRLAVEAENVGKFRIFLAPAMGDLTKPFEIIIGGKSRTFKAEPVSDQTDYTAAITISI